MPNYSSGTISIPNVTGNIVITAVAAQAVVSSITAVFTQGSSVIYTTDSLDTLKQYLAVTAYYENGTSGAVEGYTLSGTLTEGTSTITVSFGGKTTTFNVTVTKPDLSLYNWDFTKSIVDSKQGVSATLGSGATQGASGLTFDGTNNGWVYLANLSSYSTSAFTVEVDVTTATRSSGATTSTLICLSTSNDLTNTNPCGLVADNSTWFVKTTDNSNKYFESSYAVNNFNGHTAKLQVNYSGKAWSVYNDDTLVGTVVGYQNSNSRNYLGLSTQGTRCMGSGTVITGVRVYEGVV